MLYGMNYILNFAQKRHGGEKVLIKQQRRSLLLIALKPCDSYYLGIEKRVRQKKLKRNK